MTRAALSALTVLWLSAMWIGPLPDLARESFAAHMTMHMGVVAIAAPLIALAVAGSRRDPVRRVSWLGGPILASMIELVIVWGWHVPAMHQAARHHLWTLVLEQSSFLGAGVLLWMAVLGGDGEQRRLRAGSGVIALLFTSMHMTLLGALLALANRPLFQHAGGTVAAVALSDQQLGGVIMLLVGGASYLVGGLWLTARMLGTRIEALAQRESFS
jgi:putative membrane protein